MMKLTVLLMKGSLRRCLDTPGKNYEQNGPLDLTVMQMSRYHRQSEVVML